MLGAVCGVPGAEVPGAVVPGAVVLDAQQPPRMPTLPLTQLEEHTLAADLDNHTFTLTFAQPVAVRELLLLIVRGTSLSMVPDPAIGGSFIGELRDVTVRQALGLILPPLGLEYSVDGRFVRVFKREPETRLFDINYAATDRSASSIVGGDAGGRSSANVSSTTKTDVFGDLMAGVRTLLSDRAAFNVDRKAGLLQVTDFPERLDRVAIYLDAVQDRVRRQVQFDARILEVELSDEKASSIDWNAVAASISGDLGAGQRRQGLTGLRVTDVSKLMTALSAQGKVVVVASPRLHTLNNEPAIVHTETLTFSVTPQIAPDALTLSFSPIVKTPMVAESDMIARVLDGETLVVSGFTEQREVKERKVVGISGGWFGRSTVLTKKHVELIILLTPKILVGTGTQ